MTLLTYTEPVSAPLDTAAASFKATLRELHSLKGDAGMLDLAEVAALAKDCEKKVERLHADSTDAEIEYVVAALRQLEHLIEGLEATHPSKPSAP